MPKSLLEQLPEIVAAGRKEAEKLLEGIESRAGEHARRMLQDFEGTLVSNDSPAYIYAHVQEASTQEKHHPY